MTPQRWAGVAGISSVVLLFAGQAIASKPNEPAMTDERLLDFYNDSGNQYRIYAAAVVGVVAAMLFLWFLAGLREALLAAGGPGVAATLAFAAGVAVVAVSIVQGAVGAAIPATFLYDDKFALRDADVARLVLVLGNHWLSGAAASVSALVVAASSVAGRAAGLFPRWLVSSGYVIAAILLVSMPTFAGITFAVLALWIFLVSVRMLRSTP